MYNTPLFQGNSAIKVAFSKSDSDVNNSAYNSNIVKTSNNFDTYFKKHQLYAYFT